MTKLKKISENSYLVYYIILFVIFISICIAGIVVLYKYNMLSSIIPNTTTTIIKNETIKSVNEKKTKGKGVEGEGVEGEGVEGEVVEGEEEVVEGEGEVVEGEGEEVEEVAEYKKKVE